MKRLLFVVVFCTFATAARADDTLPADDTVQADAAPANDPVQASAADYSYVRLGYTYETLPNELLDRDNVFSGMALDFSWAFSKHWALIVSHYSAEQEDPFYAFYAEGGFFLPMRKSPQEYTGIGGLYHRSLGVDTELQLALEVGDLGFWYTGGFFGPSSRSFSGDNRSGTRISAGLSSRFFNRMEAKLLLRKFQYMDSERSDVNELDETVIEANYFFTEKYSAGLSFTSNDFTDRFAVNAGYSF
jgi:hypothetical protein